MVKLTDHLKTHQREPARDDQVENRSGGHVWNVGKWTALTRFLILGTSGGTYYATERELTRENAKVVLECAKESGRGTIKTIVDISDSGRAASNTYAIFAMALLISQGDKETRQYVAEQIGRVCRTFTHIAEFAMYVDDIGGWGNVKRRALSNWIHSKSPASLAYQMAKYKTRHGRTLGDILRIAHTRPKSDAYDELFAIATGNRTEAEVIELDDDWAQILQGDLIANRAGNPKQMAALTKAHHLTREMVPTRWRQEPEVWAALLDGGMPMWALVRNLGNITKAGLLKPMSSGSYVKRVVDQLTDAEALGRARMHPMALLKALCVYGEGAGFRGSNSWTPNVQVVAALEHAFHKSFEYVDSVGGNIYLGVDVSSSMGHPIDGGPLTCAEAAAAMAMQFARTAGDYDYIIRGFAAGGRNSHSNRWGRSSRGTEMRDIHISDNATLDAVLEQTRQMTFGATNCAAPMLDALDCGYDNIDAFVVLTDNETNVRDVHPFEALQNYRDKHNPNARLVVVGMTANDFTIADPKDPGMLDVVGMDTATPKIVADFMREGI